MAILGLASSRADLRRRLSAIVVGVSRSGRPVTAAQLGAVGSMMALLNDALAAQPGADHGGHAGAGSHGAFRQHRARHQFRAVAADGAAAADYVVNEAGFAADLGAEKYFDIAMRSSGIEPAAAVLVTTVQSLRAQGEGSLEAGIPNLDHHIQTLKRYGVPVIVAINRFPADTQAELDAVCARAGRQAVPCSFVDAFAQGGPGAVDLAEKVVELVKANPLPAIQPVYSLEDTPEEKIEKVATLVYGAAGVALSDGARRKLEQFKDWGFGSLPVCIARRSIRSPTTHI